MRILIDVNVLIDAITGRKPFDETAQKLVLYFERHYSENFVTADSLTNLYYVLRRLTKSRVKTREVMESTLELFRVLDITESDCRLALKSGREDFEDAVLMETAHRNHIDYIVTRNVKDFSHSPVPVISPAEFLKKVEK